ncbi:MAG: alpha/beta hydrolase [Planctomycetota bacterium]
MKRLRRIILLTFVGLAAAIGVAWLASLVSLWPVVLLVRFTFDRGAIAASEALLPHVPPSVRAELDVEYRTHPRRRALDVYLPPSDERDAELRTIVWIHGGGFVSGTKAQVGNYARILAGRGFAVVAVDYSIAPEATHPQPVLEVDAALRFLGSEARRWSLDTKRLVLAGDSAGSHIAAQLALAHVDFDYRERLGLEVLPVGVAIAGLVLCCGIFDPPALDFEGELGWFLRTAAWAYAGRKDFAEDATFALTALPRFLPRGMPPVFLTAGNADPLLPQSLAFADALRARDGRVETLFFPAQRAPALGHEYQFNLDDAGREALEAIVRFVASL